MVTNADLIAWTVLLLLGVGWWIVRRGRRVREVEEQLSSGLSSAPADIQTTVQAYGKFLEEIDLGPLDIRDVKELPYPKRTSSKHALAP